MGPRTLLPWSKDEQLRHRLQMNERYASLRCARQKNCRVDAVMSYLWEASGMKNHELAAEILKLHV
jgi:hypothetical protein